MSRHNKYIKPETEIIHIDQEYALMAGSDGDDPGTDKNPYDEAVDPSMQLAKPSGPFRRSMWED